METKPLDLVIIGGGITGVICLYWAKKRKLNGLLVEKASSIGGLWRDLPEWQDIQMQAGEWTINDVPIRGVRQGHILENIRAWVTKYNLEDRISLETRVTKTRWIEAEKLWEVHTSKGAYRARYVLVATGQHNDPYVPTLPKENSQLLEVHSSQLRDPKILKGKRVAILGGRASAFDAVDLCFENAASEVHWIYRKVGWMVPTSQPKDFRPGVRILARNQVLSRSQSKLYEQMDRVIRAKYEHFGLSDIVPSEPLNLEKDQIVIGRPLLTRRFKKIIRHKGTIDKISGNRITVGNDSFDADILIYATGYNLNLKYLDLPEFNAITKVEQLFGRCGTYMLSVDYPNLFFMGAALLDINGITPLVASMTARTVMSHIQGKCEVPKTLLLKKPVHWKMMDVLAAFDRSNFWPFFWKIKYGLKAIYYARNPNAPIRFP